MKTENNHHENDRRYWRKVRRARRRARRFQKRRERIERFKANVVAFFEDIKKKRKKRKARIQRQRERELRRREQQADQPGGFRYQLRRHFLRVRRFFLRLGRRLRGDFKALAEIDYRHYLALSLLTLALIAAFSVCSLSIERLGDAVFDLKSSAVYYWHKVVLRLEEIPTDGLTINKLPRIDLQRVCPFSIEDIQRKLTTLWPSLFSKYYFLSYVAETLDVMYWIGLLAPSIIILLVAVPMLLKILLFQHETSRKDSKPLFLWKKHVTPILSRVMNWLRDFWRFLADEGYTFKLILLWMVNLNIMTVIVEFFAWYLHFATGLDFSASFISFVRFVIDLLIMLWSAPFVFWCVIAWKGFDAFRRDIGYSILRHNEAKNAGFFSALAVVVLIVGTMGKGKTTMLTSLALTGQNYFRRKAQSLMFSLDMKFPKFPIRRFEDAIDAAHEAGCLHKLRHVKEFVDRKKAKYEKCPSAHNLYGYDIEHGNMSFDDGLKITELFGMLEAYAKLYYLYTIRLPLLIGNYSIRSDADLRDKGNFPVWDDDFFEKSSAESEEDTQYSHILDMDTMRLGKLMDPEDPFRGSKDVGIVTITEMGKERGNMLEHKGLKKDSETANPLNDGFTDRLKMERHAGLIENFSFTKVLGDEQREESLGADARDLSDVIKIREKSEPKLAMPFYGLGNLFYELFGEKIEKIYYEYRYERGDQTLFQYAMKNLFCLFYHHHIRIVNTFGYHELSIEMASGKGDEQGEMYKFYIAYKKDYSARFKSDGFGDAFNEQSKLTDVGLEDYPQFEDLQSSAAEMKLMHSYFADRLLEQMINKIDEEEQ